MKNLRHPPKGPVYWSEANRTFYINVERYDDRQILLGLDRLVADRNKMLSKRGFPFRLCESGRKNIGHKQVDITVKDLSELQAFRDGWEDGCQVPA